MRLMKIHFLPITYLTGKCGLAPGFVPFSDRHALSAHCLVRFHRRKVPGMTDDLNANSRRGKAVRRAAAFPSAEQNVERTVIGVERSGDWMPAEELRDAALQALAAGHDVTLNLDRIDHLDASASQILLALGTEQQKRGRSLELINASPHLRQWFEFAGASEHLFRTARSRSEPSSNFADKRFSTAVAQAAESRCHR